MTFLERARILVWAFFSSAADIFGGMRYIPASYWLAMLLVMWGGLIAVTVLTNA